MRYIMWSDFARIAKASVTFGKLRANVLEQNGINLGTKLKVYKARTANPRVCMGDQHTSVMQRDLIIST